MPTGLTTYDGSKMIRAGTLTADRLAASFGLATSQLADGAKFIKSDGSVSMLATLAMNTNSITGLVAGVNATDAVNVGQLNALKAGTQLHFARVVAATNGVLVNVASLSGLGTYDGYTLTENDVIFLAAQTTQSQNGPWVAHSGAWTRPTDWATASTKPEGQYFIVDADGANFANTKYFITNTGTITVDTTAVTVQQDKSGTSYSADNTTLSLSGSTFSARVSNGLTTLSGGLAVQAASGGLLTVSASGVGISSSGSNGQVVLGNASNAPTWTTLSGDVASVTGAGAVTLASNVMKSSRAITGEVPAGTVNGTNTTFTLANTPVVGPTLYYDGARLRVGAAGVNDYSISGATITLNFAPQTADVGGLLADYSY